MPLSTPQQIGEVLSMVKALAPMQQEGLLSQDRAMYQQRSYRDQYYYLQDSRLEFMEELEKVMSELGCHSHIVRLDALHRQVLSDEAAVGAQADRLHQVQDRLSQLWSTVAAAQEKLGAAVEGLQRGLTEDYPEMSGLEMIPQLDLVPTRQQSAAELPAPVRDYFDKVGDVSVMQERLDDVQSEYAAARAEVIFLIEHEQQPPVSEFALDARYFEIFAAARDALERALISAEAARLACEEAGIDIDAHRHAASIEPETADTRDADLTAAETSILLDAPEDRLHTVFSHALSEPSHEPRSPDDAADTRISEWLQSTSNAISRSTQPHLDSDHPDDIVLQTTNNTMLPVIREPGSQESRENGSTDRAAVTACEAFDCVQRFHNDAALAPPSTSRQMRRRATESDIHSIRSRHDSHCDNLGEPFAGLR